MPPGVPPELSKGDGMDKQRLSLYPDEAISSVPCAMCGGQVVEFSVPNDIWNKVIRLDGHEHDKEYLCMDCFFEALRRALGLTQG